MSLETTLAGIPINICLMNASGCWCTKSKELNELIAAETGCVVSKSGTVNPRQGNPKPRSYFAEEGSINSMGVPNLGYDYYTNYFNNVPKNSTDKETIFMQSLIPFSKNDLIKMLESINEHKNDHKRLIEVNLSCPNIINKSILGYDFEQVEEYLKIIQKFKKIIIGVKLPPYYDIWQFDTMSKLLLKYNIKFITCINSLSNALILDLEKECTRIYPKQGLGGVGGTYCKPVALANVWAFYQRLDNKIDIIGCGGISSGKDVFEHILCGATMVQIGSHLMFAGPSCFTVIAKEIKELMAKKDYNNIQDFKGKLCVIPIEIEIEQT